MKNVLFGFGLTVLALSAQALPKVVPPVSSFQHIDICALGAEEDLKILSEVSTIDIKEVSSLSPFLLSLVNVHLQEQNYAQKSLSFEEAKDLFVNGSESYNELYVITIKSLATGSVYIHVQSYPGDNPYGEIFDSTGKIVAENRDGDISLVTSTGEFNCHDIQNN